MNGSFQKYPASEIPQPKGLQKYEICTASGQLATDQCYDTVAGKGDGASRRRTTYFELATEDQAPKIKCSVHSGSGMAAGTGPIGQNPLDDAPSPSKYPRATMVFDSSKFSVVPMLGPTVLGEDDPYQSVKPNIVMAATRVGDNAPPPGATRDNTTTPANLGNQGSTAPATIPGAGGTGGPAGIADSGSATTDGTVRVMRAQAAGALDSTQDDSTIHLDPPEPIKF